MWQDAVCLDRKFSTWS